MLKKGQTNFIITLMQILSPGNITG